jgi:tripartite-type tricarboxylate transporter receptor subunit TctC
MSNRRALHASACAAAILAAAIHAHAQPYPDKPIRLVIGFTPGTTTDILARIIGQHLAVALGQPVVVENRDGAGGGIAAERVAKSTPDGYTLLLGSSSQLVFAPSVNRKLPYDPLKDYAHVIMIAQTQNVLAVHPSLAAGSVKELVALAKAKPAALNYASTGKGTTSHFSAELFKRMTDTDIVEIAYKSAAQATADLMGGHVALSFPSLSPTIPHIKSGKLRRLP